MNELCIVCSEPLTPPSVAICNFCGGDYHLQTRQDLPAKDCGDAWIDDQLGHVLFGCQRCIEAGRVAAAEDAG